MGARRGLEAAAQRLKQHRDLTARIDADREIESTFARELPQHAAREQEARAALARTQLEVAAIEKTLHGLSARERQLERFGAAVLRAQRKKDLTRQLQVLEAAAEGLRETDAQLAHIKVKPNTVENLDELDRQIASADAQLSAAAAQLAIDVKAAGEGKVRIGSLRAKGSYSAPVVAPTSIAIGDLAVVTVTPAAQPRQEKREELDAQRLTLLKSVGVDTVAEAHALLAKRRDLEASRKGTLAQLKTLDVTDDAAAAVDKLKSTLAETQAAIDAVLSEAEDGQLPTHDVIEERRASMTQERTAAEGRRESLNEVRQQQQCALEAALASRSGASRSWKACGTELPKTSPSSRMPTAGRARLVW